ncbi:DUF2255 family protein [Agrococcus jejuensis]|nr:DUF2255 family protein [Agrococcus jejuensis]
MTEAWDAAELRRIDAVDELEIASRRPDGSLSPDVTIWMVAAGGALFVRSAYGVENGWYRRAARRGAGRVSAGGVTRDVAFAPAGESDQDAVDAAYRAKYGARYPSIVGSVVSAASQAATLRVTPPELRFSARCEVTSGRKPQLVSRGGRTTR